MKGRTITVRAVPGRLVRDQVSKTPIPESGARVPDSQFWRRRIACGDVALVEED
jgi:hypothetical protein